MFGWITKLFSQNQQINKSLWQQELEKRVLTKPINFGHKCIWAAVRTENTDSLLNTLELVNLEKTDWVNGMLNAHKGSVFVLPPIEGWILITGWGLPIPDHEKGVERSKDFLNKLSEHFNEAQLFGNHSVSSAVFWMKSINGQTERLYSIGDGDSFIEGNPTPIEHKWDFIDTNSSDADKEEYWGKMIYPDSAHVLEIAKKWSLNPMELENKKGIGEGGYVGRLYLPNAPHTS